ncbi:MAG TPA: hypothetical protein VEG60_07305 [Candidatus Binatia bacterium]|nr:hypothetical protein [Candidatus Binatia bacterium]
MQPDHLGGFCRQKNLPALRYWLHAVLGALLIVTAFPAYGSNHYTDQQLDALAARVGRTYWIVAVKSQTPVFLSSPAATGATFRPQDNESFEITELVGRRDKNPYYKVKFGSGKEAFIAPEAFLEQLNLGIASVDPRAIKKKRAAEAAAEEKKRVAWIEAQPWSRVVKDAAIKRQVIGGMNQTEVRNILGKPIRENRVQTQLNVEEEHWFYADGSTAVFFNGILNRIEPKPPAEQK